MAERKAKIFVGDAFTDTLYSGNQAAFLVPDSSYKLSDAAMQLIAREFNLSETAFLEHLPNEDDTTSAHYNLRWFTPTIEVILCGHATLATAHFLFHETDLLKGYSSVTFHTRQSGKLIVTKGSGKLLQLDFPLNKPHPIILDAAIRRDLIHALGIKHDDSVIDIHFNAHSRKLLVEINSAKELISLSPNMSLLQNISFSPLDVRGVIVTTNTYEDEIKNSYEKYDFLSRYFAPWVGIPEDPVTGSAHTVLGPYWSEKIGKTEFLALQRSSRGGVLQVKVNAETNRVFLAGEAKTIIRGEIVLPPEENSS